MKTLFNRLTHFLAQLLFSLVMPPLFIPRVARLRVTHLKADTFALPLADNSVDLVLAQNTIADFEGFTRICRPGGMVDI